MTRRGAKLLVGDRTFRFAGANLDWLVLANDRFGSMAAGAESYYPSKRAIDDAFDTLVKMNGTVARVWSAGCQGSPLSIQPAPGKANQRALCSSITC